MDERKDKVIAATERGAEYLYRFRKLYFASWVVTYIVLGILQLRGHDMTLPFLLAFMWLFSIGFSVNGLRWSANRVEIEKHKGVAPDIVYRMVKTRAFYYYTVFIVAFFFVFLAYFTYSIAFAQ